MLRAGLRAYNKVLTQQSLRKGRNVKREIKLRLLMSDLKKNRLWNSWNSILEKNER